MRSWIVAIAVSVSSKFDLEILSQSNKTKGEKIEYMISFSDSACIHCHIFISIYCSVGSYMQGMLASSVQYDVSLNCTHTHTHTKPPLRM